MIQVEFDNTTHKLVMGQIELGAEELSFEYGLGRPKPDPPAIPKVTKTYKSIPLNLARVKTYKSIPTPNFP